MVTTITGDIAYADVDLIVQQCNCLTIRAHGLSQHLADVCGVNPYRRRLPLRRNLAVKEDRSIPGTVRVYSRSSRRPYHLACLFSQFSPGKPQMYYQDICREHHLRDDAEQRIGWFKDCLELLSQKADKLDCKTVAFPYRIGCGLAGGKWDIYSAIIEDWAQRQKFAVFIVKQ